MTSATSTATDSATVVVSVSWHKPEGRGRHFRRQARGLARRLRLPFVRRVLRERDNPQMLVGRNEPTYAWPWISDNALSNASFACTCHKRARYDRKRDR